MQNLLNGLYSKFTGSTGAGSLHADLGGRLYFDEARQNSAYPYGVYYLISDVPSWTFDADFEEYLIQFNLFDDDSSSADVNTAQLALMTLYDWTTLTSSGYTNIYMQREFSNLTREEDVWNYMTQYRVFMEKN